MTVSPERNLLQKSFDSCFERTKSLTYSLNKMRPLFELTPETAALLTDEQKESLDALIIRYTQCVSIIQDQIFKGLAIAEQEDITDKSNRDKTLLMEKLGAIESADEFGLAAILRNKFAHHYPEELQEQVEKLNFLFEKAQFIVGSFEELVTYTVNKGFIPQSFLAAVKGWSAR